MPAVHDVNLVPIYGDSLLGGHGIGHLDYTGSQPTALRCGIFPVAVTTPMHQLPNVGTEYVATGTFDETGLPFRFTVRCTQAARPSSTFSVNG